MHSSEGIEGWSHSELHTDKHSDRTCKTFTSDFMTSLLLPLNRAMNRSLPNVILGNWAAKAPSVAAAAGEKLEHQEIDAVSAAEVPTPRSNPDTVARLPKQGMSRTATFRVSVGC